MASRPLIETDLPQVADLYWNVMRERKGPAPPAVRSILQKLYFTNPWRDSAIQSLVYEDKGGKIVGFLGVIARKMSLCGQPVRVAFGGNFVVNPEARKSLAGMRLLGTYMAGEQDLSATDSANDVSRTLLERLRFRTIMPLSIHWSRPLRPGHYAAHMMTKSKGPAISGALKLAAKPFCSLLDGAATRFSGSPFHQAKSPLHGSELDLETLLQCLIEFRNGYSLWPEYDIQSLHWLVNFIEHRPSRGALRKIVVRDDSQKIVGWYIYYVNPGSVGEVVQIAGDPKFTKDVLDHLFYDAWERGLIALHGVLDTRRMADFSDKNCFFTCRGGWAVAHSRKPEILEVLERGDAFLSRLDGEWCLNPGVD